MFRSFRFPVLAMLALFVPASLRAVPPQLFAPNMNATGTTQIVLPATINKLYDMDFGFMTEKAAGTSIVDSSTGAVTTAGGVLFVGGLPHAAEFEAVSPSKTV